MYSLKKMTQKISKTYTLSFPKAAHSLEAQDQGGLRAVCAVWYQAVCAFVQQGLQKKELAHIRAIMDCTVKWSPV